MSSGMVYPDGHEESAEQIKARLYKAQFSEPRLLTPLPEKKDFDYWTERMRQRQEQYRETTEFTRNHVEIEFDDTIALAFIGDVHTGNQYVDYERIGREIRVICNTPNAYVIEIGDLIDSMFWNPGQLEQIEQIPEQIQYTNALNAALAERNKLLVGFGGDHDKWASRMGVSMYTDFSEKTHAYYMQGLGFLSLKVGNETYRISAAHRLPGNSIYNKNHPQIRAYRSGGAWGSDIVVSGHTHQKSHQNTAVSEFGGVTRRVHYISVGPYKWSDDYAQKLGFAQQGTDELYGCAVILHKDGRRIDYFDDIIDACERRQML